MNNKLNATPKVGGIIVVTDRKVSQKVQPKVKRGGIYDVAAVTQLKSGATCLICTMRSNKKQQLHINSERFNWRVVTEKDIARAEKRISDRFLADMKKAAEIDYRKKVSESVHEMINAFDEDECVQIMFVPLVIAQLAFIYADKAKQYCIDHRISETKPVSRAIDKIKSDWETLLSKDLDREHRDNIKQQTMEFLEYDMQRQINIFYFTLLNEFNRQYPNDPYPALRVYTHISVLFILAYDRHNRKMDDLIETRSCKGKSISNPILTDKLFAQMSAYCGNFILKKTKHMETFERIFDNAISTWKFDAIVDKNVSVIRN